MRSLGEGIPSGSSPLVPQKGQARVLRCEYPAPWRRLLSPRLTGPHPLVLTAHFQPAAPRWRGREAQPATEPSQEA